MTEKTLRKKRPRDPAQLAKFVVDVATGEIEDKDALSQQSRKLNAMKTAKTSQAKKAADPPE